MDVRNAGNEPCPQPQTSEHLAAIEIMKLKNIIILQNKIDLIKDTAANEQYQQILKFIKGNLFNLRFLLFSFLFTELSTTLSLSFVFCKSDLVFSIGTIADGAPIVPISAQLKFNIDVICEYIVKKIPIPVRDFLSSPRLIVIRSFDVNKPGAEVDDLKGGVAGGSIMRGRSSFCLSFPTYSIKRCVTGWR